MKNEKKETEDRVLDIHKIMCEQMEILHEESKRAETTAQERVEISRAMLTICTSYFFNI